MFRPSVHGWPFGNAYACTGPELGTAAPPPDGLGLAGGLCWTALDRYLRSASIPREVDAPEPGDPLYAELLARQVAALAGQWSRIRTWQGLPDESWLARMPLPLPGPDVASRTRREWRFVRRQLDRGRPVLLTLLPAAEGYRRHHAARQVLATGWSRAGRRVALSIYDPDRPGDDDVHLTFSRSGSLDAELGGHGAIRGFMAVRYDREPPSTLRTSAFDDRSVLGLNRKVRGRVDPAISGGRVDLVGRNAEGALIHFYRDGAPHWEGFNVSEAEELGDELHSDPVAVRHGGALHVFARNYVGDLLHFKHRRSWKLSNRTDTRQAGAQFRVTGRVLAVPGPWLRLSVLGQDSKGGLVHYHSAPFRGWRAEQVPGDPARSEPAAVQADSALHIVAAAHDGRVLHWRREDTWTWTDTDAGPGPVVRTDGQPTLIMAGGRPHVLARDRESRLAILALRDDGVWQRELLAADLAGDPSATIGPAGLHVFAPLADGGVLHAWWAGNGWRCEDIVATRPTLQPLATGEADLTCWGSDAELRVFVRSGSTLRALSWRADADWAVDGVTTRAGDPCTLVRDGQGRPHLVFSDGRGTVLHVETGAWREPERVETGGRAASRPRQTAASSAATGAADTADGTDAAAGSDQAADADEVVDFEAERLRAPDPDEAPAVDEAPGADEAVGTAPSGKGSAEELPLLDEPSSASRQEPAPAVEPESAAETENPEFRWEDAGPLAPDDMEPMDLSLLDSWPPDPRKQRSKRRGPDGRTPAAGPDADREAS